MAGYLYEQLDDETFQQLCQALLAKLYPDLQCLPVGQPDGGRDAFRWRGLADEREVLVFQVKFVRQPLKVEDPHRWLTTITRDEAPKVAALTERMPVARYVLLTNVAGTAHPEVGSIDQVDSALRGAFNVPAQCWWRDDLDRRLDGDWALKWRYHQILSGIDALGLAFQIGAGDERRRRESAIKGFLRYQHDSDRDVKFKQIELQTDLVDLFVDVPATLQARDAPQRELHRRAEALFRIASIIDPKFPAERRAEGDVWTSESSDGTVWQLPAIGAARLLLHPACHDSFQRIVLEGAPGQGKSTLAQFACQVHRLQLLNDDQLNAVPAHFRALPPRLPIKVDLRDYASWLNRADPFDTESSAAPPDWHRSLEAFLAHLISHQSGGISFNVADLHAVLERSSALLVLDGLDEVADVDTRNRLVDEAARSISRLEDAAASLQTVVTSRPANFANSPGFSGRRFVYFDLVPLPKRLVVDYTDKWIIAKRLSAKDATDVRKIVRERLEEPHLRELARNPMQLAILLSVVHTRGVSLPDKRTALYNIYIDLFFNREAEKDQGVRDYRDLLIDIHGYLAWLLQSEAETGGSGRISVERVRRILDDYLQREERSRSLVDELFRGMVQRVLALVSRIQGTLEFEVQPLREYFAARYLYETAPPSPIGDERTGSKPDRFEALATNFYWLNVARFYAGFYQKGELPSLVEQIQDLMERPGYRNTRHPRMLAAVLLSDWVFAQNNRSMRRITELVLDGLGVKDVLLSGWPGPGSGPLVLPEGNGRQELVERCFKLLKTDPPLDYAGELARLLTANATPDELKDVWWPELANLVGDSRRRWLIYAGHMGLLRNLDDQEFQRIADLPDLDQREIAVLWSNGQSERCERVAGWPDIVLTAILDNDLFFAPGRASTPLEYVASSLSPMFASVAFGGPGRIADHHSLNDIVARRTFDGESEELESRRNSSIGELANTFAEERKRPAREWAETLSPWDNVIESGRQLWGDHRAFASLATFAAGIRSREEDGRQCADLLDHTQSLAMRVRYARLRSGAPGYWRTILDQELVGFDRYLVALVMMAWAGGSVFNRNSEAAGLLLDGLEADEFRSIGTRFRFRNGPFRTNIDPVKVLRDITGPGPRLVVALGRRSTARGRRWLFENFLAERPETERPILQFQADVIQSEEPIDERGWRQLAAVASAAYAKHEPLLLWTDGLRQGHETMPITLAEEITEEAERFPRRLVAVAEAICRVRLGRDVVPVASVAAAEGWFG